MIMVVRRTCFLALFAVRFLVFCPTSLAATAESLPLFILNSSELIEIRKRIESDDSVFLPAMKKLKRDADRALTAGPFSVTRKELTPPGGDKHDYMSIAPYWWPNPSSPNGLPYIRRDGEVNPERDQTSDRKHLDSLVQSVKTLALGFFFTRREDYAAHAGKLLRVWFLDDSTRMKPHLRYAQAIPGRSQGGGAGIIETHNLPELVDAVGLLSGSKSWNQSERKSLQDWFSAYLNWLLESPEGKAEAKAENNHGTWYDVQLAAFALFAGRDELAKKIMTEFPSKRIVKQIEPDGRQPHELGRTQAWSYSIFNLEAFFSAASIGDKLGVDLWNYESSDKRSLRRALDWLMPFATGEKKWSHQQISGMQRERLAPLLRLAAIRYREPAYEKAITKIPTVKDDERWQLLSPRMPEPK